MKGVFRAIIAFALFLAFAASMCAATNGVDYAVTLGFFILIVIVMVSEDDDDFYR